MQTTANWLRTRAWKATDAKTDVRDGSGEINENITTLTHSVAARSSQKIIGERCCILTRIRGVAQWLVKRQNNQFAEWRRVEFVTLSVLTPKSLHSKAQRRRGSGARWVNDRTGLQRTLKRFHSRTDHGALGSL
jgi:hypothetical protein